MTKTNTKLWGITTILTLVVSVGVMAYFFEQKPDILPQIVTPNQDVSTPKEESVNFAAMGDMLAHDTVIQRAKNGTTYNFGHYFKETRRLYKDSDAVFCSQEGPSAGEQLGVSGYPVFNAPTEFADGLTKGGGCNVISLANDHIADKSVEGVAATRDRWSSLKPLAISGAQRDEQGQAKVSYFTLNGVKFGFIAFADLDIAKIDPPYLVNSYRDTALVNTLTKEARKNADIVIAAMHWGVEASSEVSADQERAAKQLADANVDVVLGAGPHVLQQVSWINGSSGNKTLVWYSLGNYVSSQLTLKQRIGGIAKFSVKRDSKGKAVIENPAFVPTYMHYDWSADDEKNNRLDKRENLMMYPLRDATPYLETTRFNTSVDEQYDYVRRIIGSEVTVQ